MSVLRKQKDENHTIDMSVPGDDRQLTDPSDEPKPPGGNEQASETGQKKQTRKGGKRTQPLHPLRDLALRVGQRASGLVWEKDGAITQDQARRTAAQEVINGLDEQKVRDSLIDVLIYQTFQEAKRIEKEQRRKISANQKS